MDHDQQLRLIYLLAILVLPVMALIGRFQVKKRGLSPVVAEYGGHTYEGEYWVEQGIVYVRCEAGRRGGLPGPQGSVRRAEELLVDIYRDAGRLQA